MDTCTQYKTCSARRCPLSEVQKDNNVQSDISCPPLNSCARLLLFPLSSLRLGAFTASLATLIETPSFHLEELPRDTTKRSSYLLKKKSSFSTWRVRLTRQLHKGEANCIHVGIIVRSPVTKIWTCLDLAVSPAMKHGTCYIHARSLSNDNNQWLNESNSCCSADGFMVIVTWCPPACCL